MASTAKKGKPGLYVTQGGGGGDGSAPATIREVNSDGTVKVNQNANWIPFVAEDGSAPAAPQPYFQAVDYTS
jgi:hypothetical protein